MSWIPSRTSHIQQPKVSTKVFRLLKDLPGAQKGTFFTFWSTGVEEGYAAEDKGYPQFLGWDVEESPEWFEEVYEAE